MVIRISFKIIEVNNLHFPYSVWAFWNHTDHCLSMVPFLVWSPYHLAEGARLLIVSRIPQAMCMYLYEGAVNDWLVISESCWQGVFTKFTVDISIILLNKMIGKDCLVKNNLFDLYDPLFYPKCWIHSYWLLTWNCTQSWPKWQCKDECLDEK